MRRSPVRRPPPAGASQSRARRRVPAAAAPSGPRRRAAPRRGTGPGPPGRDARRPGARRHAVAGTRSGRDPGRRPPGAARSPSRRGRTRRCDPTTARSRAMATSSVDSVTRTQNDSTLPRPTRPRSWWSWARPNRSAPWMIIIVAAGTSTPTSTTVVPTRTSSSPSRKRVISASRSAGFRRPWTIPTRSGARSAVSRTASLSAATAPSPSSAPSSMSGTTTNVRCPRAASSRTLLHVPSSWDGRLTPVWIATRPAGGVRRSETSRSAYSTWPSVRGIGVAVISRTCGERPPAFASSAPRWSTPKRCCSSMMTRPRSANETASWMSAWVPTTTSAWPDAIASRALALTSALSEPVSSVTPIPSSASSAPTVSRCWRASRSVGARRAPWRPARAVAARA